VNESNEAGDHCVVAQSCWTTLVLKSATNNWVFTDPVAGDTYCTGDGRAISHLIVCESAAAAECTGGNSKAKILHAARVAKAQQLQAQGICQPACVAHEDACEDHPIGHILGFDWCRRQCNHRTSAACTSKHSFCLPYDAPDAEEEPLCPQRTHLDLQTPNGFQFSQPLKKGTTRVYTLTLKGSVPKGSTPFNVGGAGKVASGFITGPVVPADESYGCPSDGI
jgi:hypothetical protein